MGKLWQKFTDFYTDFSVESGENTGGEPILDRFLDRFLSVKRFFQVRGVKFYGFTC